MSVGHLLPLNQVEDPSGFTLSARLEHHDAGSHKEPTEHLHHRNIENIGALEQEDVARA